MTRSGPPSSRLSTSSQRRRGARQWARAQAAWWLARSGSRRIGLAVVTLRGRPSLPACAASKAQAGRVGARGGPLPLRPVRTGRPRRSRAAGPGPWKTRCTSLAVRSPSGTTSRACFAARGAPFTHCSPCRAGPLATTALSIDAIHGTASGRALEGHQHTSAPSRRARPRPPRRCRCPWPSPSRAVQAVAGSRSSDGGAERLPSRSSGAVISATGTGCDSRKGGTNSRKIDELSGRLLVPRPSHPPKLLAKSRGPGHAARESGMEDPGRSGVEVHLVPKAQRVARDPLVPGLAGDDPLAGFEGEAGRELEAGVRAPHALSFERLDRRRRSAGTCQTRTAWRGRASAT